MWLILILGLIFMVLGKKEKQEKQEESPMEEEKIVTQELIEEIIGTIKLKNCKLSFWGRSLYLYSNKRKHRLTHGTPKEIANFLWGLRFGLGNCHMKEE